MNTINDTTGTSSCEAPTILLKDPRLKFAYPIIEVAKIAAAIREEDPRDSVIIAIGLLAATEDHALHANEAEFRNMQILRLAKRDAKNRIYQTHLILAICVATGHEYMEETARAKYREWLKSDWDDHSVDLEHAGLKIASIDEYAAMWEVGKRTRFFKSEQAAKEVIARFANWLESQVPAKQSTLIRDADSKKIVSPKNKGAKRGDDGKYDASKPVPIMEEHAIGLHFKDDF